MPSNAINLPQKLAILIDVQNMFYSAKLLRQGKLDYGRVMRDIAGSRQLVRATAYIVQKADVNQAGFHEALSKFGYDLKIKEMKVRPDNTVAKGSWDIGLAVDAMTLAPKVDTIALVAGDGDFTYLVDALKARGCRVEVYGFERSTAGELIRAADQYIQIPDEWVFKEKKFEDAARLGVQPRPTKLDGLPNDAELEAEIAELEMRDKDK
jgi:uncharacterized LabA/DUF88 family protein